MAILPGTALEVKKPAAWAPVADAIDQELERPKGRDEDRLVSPQAWVQYHDRYKD